MERKLPPSPVARSGCDRSSRRSLLAPSMPRQHSSPLTHAALGLRAVAVVAVAGVGPYACMPCMLRGWSRCRPSACGSTVQRPSTARLDRLRTCPALCFTEILADTFCRALHGRTDTDIGTCAGQCGGRAFAPEHARVCAAAVSSRSLKLFHIELKIRPRSSEFLGLGAVLWR